MSTKEKSQHSVATHRQFSFHLNIDSVTSLQSLTATSWGLLVLKGQSYYLRCHGRSKSVPLDGSRA